MNPKNNYFYSIVEQTALKAVDSRSRPEWHGQARTAATLITKMSQEIDSREGSGFSKRDMLKAMIEELELRNTEGQEVDASRQDDQKICAEMWFLANRAAVILLKEENIRETKKMGSEIEEAIRLSGMKVSAFTREVLGNVAEVYDKNLIGQFGDRKDSVKSIKPGEFE